MQGNWPDFRAWVFGVVPPSSTSSNPASSWPGPSGSSGLRPGPGLPPGSVSASNPGPYHLPLCSPDSSSFSPIPGREALGGGLLAVLQAAGGFLRSLGRRDAVSNIEKGKGAMQRQGKGGNQHQSNVKLIKKGPGALTTSSVISASAGHGTVGSGSALELLNRVASLLRGGWGKMRTHGALPAMLAAILPPIETSSAKVRPNSVGDALGEVSKEGDRHDARGCASQAVIEDVRELSMRSLEMVVEPKTGVHFPVHLSCSDFEDKAGVPSPSCQVLAGVGARSKTFVKFKSIKIYAFGLYVRPDHLRAQLGEKYGDVSLEDLRNCPDFLDDVLRHEVDMTVRLVVHYKGLKMAMVRSAFEVSLKNRLKKIAGVEDDEGLRIFCSYLSEDIALFQGAPLIFVGNQVGAFELKLVGVKLESYTALAFAMHFSICTLGTNPSRNLQSRRLGRILHVCCSQAANLP